MSCSGLANVLSGVVLILGTSSGPAFGVDHTVIDRLPQVADWDDQPSEATTGFRPLLPDFITKGWAAVDPPRSLVRTPVAVVG